jgi:hypothetical protein
MLMGHRPAFFCITLHDISLGGPVLRACQRATSRKMR